MPNSTELQDQIANAISSLKPTPEGDEFDKTLQDAAKTELTPEDMKAQRISLAMGMLPHNSKITREDIEKVIDEQRY